MLANISGKPITLNGITFNPGDPITIDENDIPHLEHFIANGVLGEEPLCSPSESAPEDEGNDSYYSHDTMDS